jgi:NAD dependent epimerase/dehydratase family enzyme
MPAFAARLALGQMADELLLASQRVEPARLVGSGFRYQYPRLDEALRRALGER